MGAGVWVKIVAISVSAVFVLLTYMHTSFLSQAEMETHSERPHAAAVSTERYNTDMGYLRKEITAINQKLDRALR